MFTRAELKNKQGNRVVIEESKKTIKVYLDAELINVQLKNNATGSFDYLLRLHEKCGYRITSMYISTEDENKQ